VGVNYCHGVHYEYPNRSDLDLRIEGEYCDVLSSNCYGSAPPKTLIEQMHRISKRPIMLTEFTFSAKDAGFPNGRSWGSMLLETQANRALAYEIYTSHAAEIPFVIGTHYFLVKDRKEITQNNWGLCDFDGKIYYDFVKNMDTMNGRLPLIHKGQAKPKRYPQDYPTLEYANNDFPKTKDIDNKHSPII